MTYYTYLYRDPKNNTPIYIGKGSNGRAHTHLTKNQNAKLFYTIQKRIREGYTVEPIINHEVDEATALQMEMFWIDFYGREDLGTGTLFNLTDGGDGGSPWRGKKHSEETKAKLSILKKGVSLGPQTEEANAKRRASMLGRKHSEESILKMSIVHKAKGKKGPVSEETRLRMSNAQTNRTISAEHSAALSAAGKLAWMKRKGVCE